MKTRLLKCLALLLLTSNFLQAQVRYVDKDASGNNNGTSWQNAYTSLPVALSNATDGEEFWIKSDTYIPISKLSSFTIQNDIELYGGFLGTETMRSQRDFRANPTIFSGDINQDDVSVSFNDTTRSDNCRVVVSIQVNLPVTIDGIIIEGGNADGAAFPDERGSAIFKANVNESLTIRNSIIRNNLSYTQGAVYADYNTPSGNGSLVIENTIFENNLARLGAAVYVRKLNPAGNIDVSISNTLFNNNTTTSLGTSPSFGGSSIYAVNNGATINSMMTTTVNNCTFADNVDNGSAGPDDTTFVAGRNSQGFHTLNLTNSIFWNNQGFSGLITRPIWVSNTQTLAFMPTLSNNLDVRNFPNLVDQNTVDQNPSFVNASQNDYTLQNGSPAIESGNNSYVASTNTIDLAGNTRVFNTAVDIGAYESQQVVQPPCTITIPDTNFKAELLSNTSINTNGDNEIQCTEATAYSSAIDVFSKNIADVTGIEAFVNVTQFYCYDNQITSIDVSQNTALVNFSCSTNQISTVDLSQNPNLEKIYVQNNNLTSLDVRNGNNTAVTNFDARNNPSLTCVSVDDVTYSNQNWSDIDAQTSFSVSCNTCIVSIPDTNFKNILLANTTINTNGNTEIECSEASSYTGALSVASEGIFDLTGIEAFVNITELNCASNQLTSLDVSQNITLTYLQCNNNLLTNIDVSQNTSLTNLSLGSNEITNIDVSQNTSLLILDMSFNRLTSLDVSQNTSLANLYCRNNMLTSIDLSDLPLLTGLVVSDNDLGSLDLSQNINLEILRCSANLLTSLDVSQLASLNELRCDNNQIISLDISQNVQLGNLDAKFNQLTSIDLTQNTILHNLEISNNNIASVDVSQNLQLENFYAGFNQLTSLDLTQNTTLFEVGLEDNNLSSLDVRNGTNALIYDFYTTNNPNLSCISVDDVSYSNANWTNIDTQTSFSTNCNACFVNIPDANFKNALLANTLINTNGNSEIECSEASLFNGQISVVGLNISDLTGIEAFENITDLIATQNTITTVDLSQNTALETVSLFLNQITTINLSNLTQLRELNLDNNQLATIDVSQNTSLEFLSMFVNQLNAIDITNNSLLTTLNLAFNQLLTIDLSVNLMLNEVLLDGNSLTALDVSQNLALLSLSASVNNLTAIDVTQNSALTSLYVYDNQLTVIDVSQNITLVNLSCSTNQISSIDLSQNSSLERIFVNNNNLTSLDVRNGNNTQITDFGALGNANLSCISVDNVAFSSTSWTSIDAQTSFSANCSLGVDDFELNNVQVFPNPAISVLNITTDLELKNIEVYNIQGQKIISTSEKVIDVNLLSNGIYIIKLQTTFSKTIIKRFVKE